MIDIDKRYLTEIVRPALSAASKHCSPVSRSFAIAGKQIRVKFYGPLVGNQMSLALAHNEVAGTNAPDLTLHIWDSRTNDISLPRPWANSSFINESLIEPKTSGRKFYGAFLDGENTVNIFDPSTKEAFLWIPDADNIPGWVRAAPARTILHWFYSDFDVHLVHGATVERDGRSVLLAAKGGSGKSTTALSCVAAGLGYLSDDYVGVAIGEQITAHSFYNSAKLTQESLNAFPELHKFAHDPTPGDQEKSVIHVAETAREQLVREAPLSAIMIPVLHKAESTRLAPATKTQALLALAPTTVFQLAFSGAEKVARLKEIVERTPCYFLVLGPDIREVPSGIDNFFARLDAHRTEQTRTGDAYIGGALFPRRQPSHQRRSSRLQ